jgi:hypothetical protein
MLCDKELPPYGNHRLDTSLAWIRKGGWQEPVTSLIVYVKSHRAVDSEDDYRAVLRDPTGVWDFNIISHCVADKFPDFTPGCVMQLQNVPVFTQRRGKHHLVITAENVVRIWPRIEMSRRELAPLSARIYDYQCIYDQIAKAKTKASNSAPSSRGVAPSSNMASQFRQQHNSVPQSSIGQRPRMPIDNSNLPLIQRLNEVSIPEDFRSDQFGQDFATSNEGGSVGGIGNFSRR